MDGVSCSRFLLTLFASPCDLLASVPGSSTFKPAVWCMDCPTCERVECVCLPGMKVWEKDNDSYYAGPDGTKHFWPKATRDEKGVLFLSCRLCSTYNQGVTFASRNSIARGVYAIKKPQGGCIRGHVKDKEKGDHQRCYDNFLKQHSPVVADIQAADSVVSMVASGKDRAVEKPSRELLNHMSWLYVALTLPASEKQFGTMVRTAQHTGAHVVADQYQGHHFFTEGMKSLVRILSEEVVTVLHGARKIGWHLDVGGGALLIRLYCLNERFARRSYFWEARKVGTHTAEGMLQAFIHAIAQRGDLTISALEVWKKTCVFVGDGASVNGVRKKGKSCPFAVPGSNLFYKFQQEHDKVLKEAGVEKHLPIIGYWCDNHELDLISEEPERQIVYVSNLMHFFRSIITHIMESDRAHGVLDYISLMVTAATESSDDPAGKSVGTLSRVSFAPQRWLAQVQPMKTLVDKTSHLIMYCLELSLDPRKGYQAFGTAMKVELEDLRFHLVLPGLLDINLCLDKANKSLQTSGVNIWKANEVRTKMEQELEDVALRDKTDEKHLNKCAHVEAALAWITGALRHKPLSKKPTYFEKALVGLKISQGATSAKVLKRVDFSTDVRDEKGGIIKFTSLHIPYSPELCKEALAILRKVARVLKTDVQTKYAETDFASDVREAFAVAWKHDADDEPACLQRLIKRLKYDEEDFLRSWRHLHHHKESVIKELLDRNILKGMTREAVEPMTVWPEVLRRIAAVPTQWDDAKLAADLLEVALLLEPSNASVEHDAGTLRDLKEVMNGQGDPLTKDSRMRIKIEGPPPSKAVKHRGADEADYHPLIREAAKDFLLSDRRLNGTNAGCTKRALSAEHKDKISSAAKKVKVDGATDLAIGVACALGQDAAEAMGEEGGFISNEAAESLLLDLDVEDDTFLSLQPPPKKARGVGGRTGANGRGKGRGSGPAAAELALIEEVIAAEAAEQEEDDD